MCRSYIAGSLALALSLLTGPRARADVYVSGFTSGGVYRFNEATGAAVGSGVFITPHAGLSLPHGVMRLTDGTFIVASAATDQVLRYSGTGVYQSVFIANGLNGMPANTMDYPVDFALGPNGDLFITSQLNDRIIRCNSITGAFISIFVDAGTVDGPSGLTWSADLASLYAVARFGNVAQRYDIGGGLAPGFISSGFNQPFGVAIHPGTGEVYVVNGGANNMRRMNPATGATLSTLSGGLGFPIGIRFGPGSDLYVASFGSDRIQRFDGGTGAAETDLVSAATSASVGLDGPNFFNFIPDLTAQEQWRILHFQTSANGGSAADSADPDGDGWSNLLEYLTARLPLARESPATPLERQGSDIRYIYKRNLDAIAEGWTFTVKWSDNLTSESWQTTGVVESILTTSGSVQTVQATLPAGALNRRFVRIDVSK